MTANEQAAMFVLLLDGSGYKERTFNDREVSKFLSMAEMELVLEYFDGLKTLTQRGYPTSPRADELSGLLSAHQQFSRTRDSFMKGTEDNGAYLTPDLDMQIGVTAQYGVFVAIPDECLIVQKELCSVIKGTRIVPNVPVKLIDPKLYAELIYDPYLNPNYDLVWGMDWGSYTTATPEDDSAKGFTGVSTKDNTTDISIATQRCRHLIPGKDFVVETYTIHYIKAPRPIVVNRRSPLDSVSSELPNIMHDKVVRRAVAIATGAVIPAESKFQVADKETKEDS